MAGRAKSPAGPKRPLVTDLGQLEPPPSKVLLFQQKAKPAPAQETPDEGSEGFSLLADLVKSALDTEKRLAEIESELGRRSRLTPPISAEQLTVAWFLLLRDAPFEEIAEATGLHQQAVNLLLGAFYWAEFAPGYSPEDPA